MKVADIQRFCMHDGPGIRTTVFFKGCPLRCAWCHNPETQNDKQELFYYGSKCIGCGACGDCPQKAHRFLPDHSIDRTLCIGCGVCAEGCPTKALELSGREESVDSLFACIEKDRAFYGETGGVTLSGGEPLAQGDAVIALLRKCVEAGISTAVETCGAVSADILTRAIPLTDLFLWDIKDTDPERHQRYTGVSNGRILSNLRLADAMGAKTRLRCILVNGVQTNEAHYEGVARLYHTLNHCEGVELLPYHAYGGGKTVALGRVPLDGDHWIPTKEQLAEAKRYLQRSGVPVVE